MQLRLRGVRWLLFCFIVCLATAALAQSQASNPSGAESERLSLVPVFTGGGAFEFSSEGSDKTIRPNVSPIILVPLGSHALFETEFEVESETTWTDGVRQPTPVTKTLEYAQLDLFLGKNTTLVLGRFATPFGFYKERMDARWIRNLQAEPLIFGFSDNSNNVAVRHMRVRANPWGDEAAAIAAYLEGKDVGK